MTFHLAAYYQSVDPAGALTQINAVTDQAIYTSGKDVRIPSGMANLLGETVLSAATGPAYGQVQSPTLRDLANQDVQPIVGGVTFSNYALMQDHSQNPRALSANEAMNFAIQATGGAAAANYGLTWIGDGPIKSQQGKIFTVRATGSAALSAGSWVNTSITFNSTLPAGTYQVVGMYAEGSNLVAARIVFVGSGYRPGVPANSSLGRNDFSNFRNGMWGVFGSFDVNQPPTIDCIGVTDNAQVFAFDLIKTG